MRIIDHRAVEAILTYPVAIELMREAMMSLSRGQVTQPLRQIVKLSSGAMFGAMPGSSPETFGAKLISVSPGNFQRGLPSHQGTVVLFDLNDGAPVALLHAGAITAIRTAAASAAATDALARPEAGVLAILGYGEQALAHARAISLVRRLTEMRVWGRETRKAGALAARMERELNIEARAVATPAQAAAGCDIISTVTGASEPLLRGEEVPTGAHVNLVGASHAGAREVDDRLVARGRFFADHLESVLGQGGEILHAIAAGMIDERHVLGEIGEVFAGSIAGRTAPADITIYKSLGSIAQDLAAGWFVFGEASRQGLGEVVAF